MQVRRNGESRARTERTESAEEEGERGRAKGPKHSIYGGFLYVNMMSTQAK